ncbi:serine hydrolase FSH [Mariannaea sp. PMI_226]|nr:serine hydrolase FSH [Mariannaea sp. PMI_226]
MKVLCLHGSFGSASNFKAQLGPFIDKIEQNGSMKFKWINGGHSAIPPKGFEHYFGHPPLYRHIDFEGISELDDMIDKIRDMPSGMTAEDTIRKLIGEAQMHEAGPVQTALDNLQQILEDDPEIDGILGYSEGAMTAATLILEERRRWEEEGRPRRIKYGIFFAGWPPVQLQNGRVKYLLADECDNVIDIPTCHIVGCNDPYIQGAMALFAMCEEDTATMFDHGKGHTVPRDPRTIKELATVIEESSRTQACM